MNSSSSNHITYNIQILPQSQEDFGKIFDTLKEHQKIWNHISNDTFKNQDLNKKVIYDRNYYPCRNKFHNCPSQIIIRAKDSVYATFKTIKSNKQTIKKAPELKNLFIRLDKRLYTFLDNNQIKLTTIDKRVTCNLQMYPKFEELFKTYKICDPLIFFKNNKLYLAVSFEIPTPTHVHNSYLGVDLGLRRIYVTSQGNAFIDLKFNKDKRNIRYQKRELNSKKKNSHSARTKLKQLKYKERNKNKNLCHKMANEILKTNSNTIVLEDLSSLKKKKLKKYNHKNGKSSKNRLSQSFFYKFKEILSYKALQKGKSVVTVDPSYTSQNDYRGHERGIRKGCRYYAQDGKVFDADWNASINIAKKYSKMLKMNGVNHPVSFRVPLDGQLNLTGRALSTAQSWTEGANASRDCKPLCL